MADTTDNRPSGTRTYAGAWEAVADFLTASDVGTVFGLPADDLDLLRALAGPGTGTGPDTGRPDTYTDIAMILCRDQRNAMFMATGHALMSGRPSVCAVGKGPATANAVAGLLEAKYSAAPVLLLAAGTADRRRGSAAFQETDQLALVAPLVKWAHRVDHPERLVPALEKALAVAAGPVPGPVYLEVPDHLLGAEIVRRRPWAAPPQLLRRYDAARTAGPALDAVRAARRPVLLVGGGVRGAEAGREVARFAEQLGAAVFCTASGRGTVREDHELFCGLSGLYARPETEEIWRRTDLVIALGSRLEETAVHGWDRLPDATPVVQINVDSAEFSAEFAGPRVIGDAVGTITAWSELLPGTPASESPPPGAPSAGSWRAVVAGARAAMAAASAAELARMASTDRLHVAEVLAELNSVLPPDHVLVQENGLQDMWSYLYPFHSTGAHGGSVVPSEQTSLGFGAAAAAGVKVAAPDRTVAAFVGDGAFELFRSDLATLADDGIGVLYVVLCNGGYGWLQSQLGTEGPAAARYSFVRRDAPVPALVARPGVRQESIGAKKDLLPALSRALSACAAGRVCVVWVPVALDDVPPGIGDADGVPQ
ncbi:thiamine pyrophosphate-binding protein [Streptomyces sp. NPDC055078]